MLSVIIATENSERLLVPTLAALIPGALAGIVREVIVADAGSRDETAAVADSAGCRVVVSPASLGVRLKSSAAGARGPWLMFLKPGAVPDATWIDDASRISPNTSPRSVTQTLPRSELVSTAKTRMSYYIAREMHMEKIGILTGGGDCPGLNAVIRAVVRRSHNLGYDVLGIRNGWAGLIHGYTEPLTYFSVTGILPRGGTILGTSRTNPFKQLDHVQQLKSNWQKFGLTYLVAVGGEDTLGVAYKLFKQEGIPIVGVPKTIDNDLAGTDYTFGFDTAVQIVTEAIDRLHTTAESHKRVMVVEVMGRHAGWIATYS